MARESPEDRRARLRRAGVWLRAEREARGLTQQQVADHLELDQVRVSAFERGLYGIDASIARDLARLFGLGEMDVWRGMELGLPRELDDPLERVLRTFRANQERAGVPKRQIERAIKEMREEYAASPAAPAEPEPTQTGEPGSKRRKDAAGA